MGVSIARIDASASSFRRENPEVVRVGGGLAGEAGAPARGPRAVQVLAAYPEVARAVGDLGSDPSREDLPVRVLEDQPDLRGELGDPQRGRVRAVDGDPPPPGGGGR